MTKITINRALRPAAVGLRRRATPRPLPRFVAVARQGVYADVHRLIKHRALGGLFAQAMHKNGPQVTRELALDAMQAKCSDTGDVVLEKAITASAIHALRMQHKRGKVMDGGRRAGLRLWTLPKP